MTANVTSATSRGGLYRFLMLWVSVLLVVGVLVFGVLIFRDFSRTLEPELERRAGLIGATIRDDTERALGLGIPLEELVGIEDYFAVFLADFPELDYLAIRSSGGAGFEVAVGPVMAGDGDGSLAQSWQYVDAAVREAATLHEFPLSGSTGEVGTIEVGIDSSYVRSRLDSLALDVGVILLVAIVVAFEVTLAVSRRVGARHDADSAGVERRRRDPSDMRLVLLVFVVAEEMNKSFLPLLIKAADNPVSWLDASLAISLPIIAYLLTIALASPFAGRLESMLGHRRLFIVGVSAAASSHLGMIFADNVLQIIGLRAITGVGYALATIASMEYLMERLSPGNRARSVTVFITIVMGGTFAGTALGGIFADRLGYDAVFAISFAMVVAAGVAALAVMRTRTAGEGARTPDFALRDIGAVLKRPALVALLAGVTIPMNVVMAAFLWYLVPLSMAELGSDASAIARTLMVYYLVILVGSQAMDRLARRGFGYRWLVGAGSVASGSVLLIPAVRPTALTISIAVLVVGVGHAAVRGPQIALAMDIADAELPEGGRNAALAAMRSLERLGSLFGLLAVALLSGGFDLELATGTVGVAVTVAGLAFLSVRGLNRTEVAGA